MTIKKPIYGLIVYFGIRMTIPVAARYLGVSFNTLCLLIFGIMTFRYIKGFLNSNFNTVERRYINRVSKYYVLIFIISLFSFYVPLNYQWSKLLQEFVTEILPSFFLMIFLNSKKDLRLLGTFLLLFSVIAAIYGIYTFITDANPLMSVFNTTDDENYGFDASGVGEDSRIGFGGVATGIFGKASLGYVLLPFYMYCFLCKEQNRYYRLLSAVVILISILLCETRTILVAIFVFLFLMYFKKSLLRPKYIAISCLLFVLLLFIVSRIPEIKTMFEVAIYIFDDARQEELGMRGSSLGMRISQLFNCIAELGPFHIFQGMGIGFTSYYYKYVYTNGMDPRFFGFESQIFRVLMSSGIFGLLLWMKLYLDIFTVLYKKHCSRSNIAFFVTFLLISIMSGDNGTLWIFLVFAVVMSKQRFLQNRTSSLSLSKIYRIKSYKNENYSY